MTGRARRVEAAGVLSPVIDTEVPEPGPGEALLAIHATSLNFHDLVGVAGLIPNAKLPRVPFSDASATVLALGPGTTGLAVGDAVVPGFYPRWRSGPLDRRLRTVVLGDQIDGTLQSRLCLPATALARAPAGLDHRQIATLGCAGLTAWRAVVEEAQVRPGQTVLLQGTGGVSLYALGFAKMVGARVIITSSSDEKLARAQALGADVAINYRTTPDWSRAVMEATDGDGADLIVEVGGGATLGQSVKAAKIGGHISVIGVLAGFEAPAFPLAQVFSKQITLRGVTVGSIAMLEAMCRAVETSGYQPVIDSVYDLDAADAAMAHMQSQRHFGKIVIGID